MAENDQTLKILVKTEGDTAGLEKTKKGLEDLKLSSQGASQAATVMGAALGASIPTTFIGAMTTVISLFKQLSDEQDAMVAAMERARESVRKLGEENLATAEAMRALERIKVEPVEQSIARLRLELIRLKTEQALVTRGTEEGEAAYKNYTNQINITAAAVAALANIQRQQRALLDDEKVIAARAFGAKEDIEQARRGQLYNQILEKRKALGLDISDTTIKNRVDEVLLAEEQDKVRAAAERTAGAQETISPLLKEQMTLLQNIRQQQQLISEAPFMGADAKQAALLASSRDEMQNIARAIEQTQAALKGSGLDATQYEQLDQRLQLLRFRFKQLGQDIQTLTFGGGLRTELTSWANSFGTTAQQIGKTIEGTIGVALQSVNQFLVTGKFNAQALLQQLVMLGLQLVEQMIIQRVMAAINAAASAGQAAVTGPIVAAAWAPAAAAATIATHGAAAAQAPASVATALALIQGMLVFAHEGGPIRRRRMHGGGLAADEVPIIAQEGEIMIQRSVAQQPGMADYLLGLNAGAFHRGGFVFGGRYHKGGGGIDVGSNVFGPDSPFNPVPPWTEPPPLHDPTDIPRGGSQVQIGREPGWAEQGQDPGRAQSLFNRLITFGISPPAGNPFGQTYNPTFWVNYPGVGPVPMAVPVGGWNPEAALHHMGQDVKTKHSGGLISRFHSGGSVGGGGGRGGAGIHIYAFTDLRALTKHMGSKEGQKIIFDTVKGRRIDLGIS